VQGGEPGEKLFFLGHLGTFWDTFEQEMNGAAAQIAQGDKE
jgi:hypothetical protein